MSKTNKKVGLDRIDLKILSALSRDGRMTKLQLSEEVGLSATPCWERMKKLEKNGTIKGYRAELNLNKIIDVSYYRVEISIKNYSTAKANEFEKLVASIAEIVECEAVLGSIDYLLKIVSPHIDAYQKTIEYLLGCSDLDIDHKTIPISKNVKTASQLDIKKLYLQQPTE
ncbi:transcriptional regulator, AsnC family [Colwellia chukchiensis]|uniref:Transcriptional regulator, AsnC family n=1 Tax=Colwellia chukchiensis TaxID=641665 RepID=A0A1H7GLB9_9GAMM|nr:winged helix-turn-helix transcriptional regulator [Colwellia chukchiensis]SEK38889.1 transcriptional regulator, AsnC family [Colwellia chukchiensis]